MEKDLEKDLERELTDEEILAITEDEIIAKLIGGYEFPTETVYLKDIGIPVTLKGLDEKVFTELRHQCTYPVKRGGKTIQELNNEEYNAAIIIKATQNFNWNNPKILQTLNLSSGKEYIRRNLPAGVVAQLVGKVLELSGFNDNSIDQVTTKN